MAPMNRIQKDFYQINALPSRDAPPSHDNPPRDYTVSLGPNDNFYTWHVTLAAPENTIYHPGRYGLVFSFPTNYPFKAPVVKFTTRIYHPNVTNDSLGNVCLALLKTENWKPTTTAAAILDAVRNLLIEPQPDDPLEDRIAEQYRNDREAFEKAAKDFVEKYAKGDPTFPAAPA